jgi:hypothetical protein
MWHIVVFAVKTASQFLAIFSALPYFALPGL